MPPSIAQHKLLQFASQNDFTNALYLLLQLPTIRLHEICLVNLSECCDYIHLCATHPDLQTTKLVIDMHGINYYSLSTFKEDMVSFFMMPSLQTIIISGNWGMHDNIKLGLVHGLKARSLPLMKLALELELCDHYKKRDFEVLCNAIFSLPQLENLELVLGKGFVDLIRQPGFEDTLYRSWSRRAARVQLKSLCLQTHESKFKKLSIVTQKLSFSLKRRVYPVEKRRTDFGFATAFGYDSDDEYGGYYDDYPYYDDDYYDDDY